MWNKLKELPRRAHGKIMEALCALKNDERGLSGVVVAILLILVAVMAIVLIWGLLGGWLQELWERITGAAGGI